MVYHVAGAKIAILTCGFITENLSAFYKFGYISEQPPKLEIQVEG